MQFLYDKRAGESSFFVDNEAFLHLKARRAKTGDRIELSNLKDGKKYLYEIVQFQRKSAKLELIFASLNERQNYDLNLAWAVIDPKTIEKTLPFLNELGVAKLIFVYTKFSQANFKLDIERFERICAMSCEQCGRDSMMKFEIFSNVGEFLKFYKNVALVNFGGKNLDERKDELLFIGPEGGFSKDEVALFNLSFGLKSKNILKSQTAILSVASKILS